MADMRLIGHVPNESAARSFGSYLYVQGIENQVEFQNQEGWGVWILDEDKLDRATQLLATFVQNPADPKYQAEAEAAARLRTQAEKDQAAFEKKVRTRQQLFRPMTAYGFGPLTLGLIVVSVVVFFLSGFGNDLEKVMGLFITDYTVNGEYLQWHPGLEEIRHGQIWRLFTPMFIHFDVLHILFNMLWLRDLGSMIEARQGSWRLAILVLAIAAGSNVAQFLVGRSPDFGGMSGVVYGLLGYVWMRGKFDTGSGFFLHPTTVTMMLIWLVLCYTGVLGHIANTVHTVGLLMGMAWGYLSSLRHR
jgi:GlpG protein